MEFGACGASIAFYGGSAGSGKSRAAVMEPLHHLDNKYFKTVIFRRTTTQIRNPGGLWDESRQVYSLVNGEPHESYLSWKFPSGATVKFAGLEHDNSVLDFQGSQIPLIIFDELTMFTEYQFWFMLSRNRSESGVPGYIRATCNPDVNSWVRSFIDWWIGSDGYPIKKRGGKIRWFLRRKDKIEWFDSKAECHRKYGKGQDINPKSFTFIPALLSDNKILLKNDPNYKSNLEAMNLVEMERLLKGNWNIRATAGSFFRREWFPIVDAIPGGWRDVVRAWDRAATEPSEQNKIPDWTRGVKMYAYNDGTYVIGGLNSIQSGPGQVEDLIKTVAQHDGYGVKVRGFQDPGSAGVKEADDFVKMLAGYDVMAEPISDDKPTRATPLSRQVFRKNVKVLRGNWNEEFFREMENFSENDKEYAHDDIVDATSLAFACLVSGYSMLDVNDGLAAAFGLQTFKR